MAFGSLAPDFPWVEEENPQVAAQRAAEAAALRNRRSVVGREAPGPAWGSIAPGGGRPEGVATKVLGAVGHIPIGMLGAAAGFVEAAKDYGAELSGTAPVLSTDYDPRRRAAMLGAETAMNLIGTPALTGGVPGAVGMAGGRLARTRGLPMDEESRLARAAEQGWQMPWYHGGQRMDRFIESGAVDPRRATSGPMPFFTDDPAMASAYAMGKKGDTSLVDEGRIADYFTVDPKLIWPGSRQRHPLTVEQSWQFLPAEVKRDILDRAKRVGYANPQEASGPYTLHPPGSRGVTLSDDHFDYIMRTEARGNPLVALREMWHDGGNLVGNETALADIFRLAGYPHPISETRAPWTEARGVFPAALRLRNPLVTDDAGVIVDRVIPQLEEAFKRDRTRLQPYGADMWDKNTRWTPRDWVAELRSDYIKGDNSFGWTSIPDKVTAQLSRQGFDSILDTGGKSGGQTHRVAIPFRPDQVRSVFGRFDPANEGKPFLLGANATDKRTGAAVVAANQEPAFGSLSPPPKLSFEEMKAANARRNEVARGIAERAEASGGFRSSDGKMMLSRNIGADGSAPTWRLTYFDGRVPTGHIEGAAQELAREIVFHENRLLRQAGGGEFTLGANAPDRRVGGAVIVGNQDAAPFGSLSPSGIRAYHGSPYDFDRFDLSKIGTGEGAQAYGHGLYFAENEGVARSYRDALATGPAADLIRLSGGDVQKAIERAKGNIASMEARIAEGGRWSSEYWPKRLEEGRATLRDLEAGNASGRMYEVNINAAPEQFLDWDRPVAEQSDLVRSAIAPGFAFGTGQDAYQALIRGKANNPQNTREAILTSRALADQGVVGIRYLDQGSRVPRQNDVKIMQGQIDLAEERLAKAVAAKNPDMIDRWEKALRDSRQALASYSNPTSNYVLFDDSLVDILRKYAIPGAAGGSAAWGSLSPGDANAQPLRLEENTIGGPQAPPGEFLAAMGKNIDWGRFMREVPQSENIEDRRGEPHPEFTRFLRGARWENLSDAEQRAVYRNAVAELSAGMAPVAEPDVGGALRSDAGFDDIVIPPKRVARRK